MVTVPHGSDEPIHIPAALDRRNRFRHLTTEELHNQRQIHQWDLVEMLASLEQHGETWDFAAETIDYAVTAIEDIDVVLDRRRRLTHRPGTPKWSRGSRRRQEDIRAKAESLRSAWPLDCFCLTVLDMTLVRRGRELVGCCPFPDHQDSTPSFSIRSDGRVWYCHGCHRGGDLFSLVGQLFAIDELDEQMQFLARRSGGNRGEK